MKKINNIEVSICISVYNTEKLLKRCLESVINQTLEKKEIILVNNGSTDSSLEIMLEYKEQYPDMIKVYSQEDKGLAQGRQTGINHAQGKYITFLDADDYVNLDAYEKMYNCAMKYDVDIVECQTIREGRIIKSNYTGVHDTSEILRDYFINGEIPTMLWMRLFKRNLFLDKLVLPNIYVNNEDIFALPCLLYKAKDIFYLQEQLHHYTTDNEESVMYEIKNKLYDETKMIQNRIKILHVIDHISEYIGKDILNKKYKKEFMTHTARIILIFCLSDFKSLSIKDKIIIACNEIKIIEKDLNKYYKNFTHYNKMIQNLIRLIGFENTLLIYRYLKKIISLIKV